MSEEKGPLWMPTGSVRAIMALVIVCSVPVFVAIDKAIPEMYWGMAGVVMAMYFHQSITKNKTGADSGTQATNDDFFQKLSIREKDAEIKKLNELLDKPQEITLKPVKDSEQ